MQPPARATLVIRGCDVLAEPGAPIAESVDLVIAGDRVASIEPTGGADASGEAARVLDGSGLLAMPGLVNAHTHSPENPMRGMGQGLTLEPWLCLKLELGGAYGPDDFYACALAGAVEMIRNGVTAVVDHVVPSSVEAVDAAMRAYRDAGIRAGVAPLVTDVDVTDDFADARGFERDGPLIPWRHDATPAELAAQLDDAIVRWHGAEDGRLRVLAGPGGVQWCSDELLTELGAVAERHGTGVHVHLLETRLQAEACRLRFGHSAARGLHELGILGLCSLPHSVWIDDGDIELIAGSGAVIVHSPAANLRLGSGRAPIRALLDAGANVGLASDGAASSDNQVLWDALKLAALIHNDEGRTWVSAREALTMATTGGAAALGLAGELGALRPGMLADVILLDRHGDGLAGAWDVEGALALSETGRGVRHAIVAGRVVLEDGRCTRVDGDAARAALAEQARLRLRHSAAADETLKRRRRLEDLSRSL